MSFSKLAKFELCEQIKASNECKACQLYGFLLSAKSFSEENIEFLTEYDFVSDYLLMLLKKTFQINAQSNTLFDSKDGQKSLYKIQIDSINECKKITSAYNREKFADLVSLIGMNQEYAWAFLKGTFLSCGSVSSPEGEYHIEFTFKLKENALFCKAIFDTVGFSPKLSSRRENYVVYFKDSTSIEDILTGIGAIKSSLNLMDTKVIKDMRNRINRKNNCETANLKKTIDVALDQIEAIKFIYLKKGQDFLSDDLQIVAKARIDNPQASLKELENLLNGQFSKSGINRRLNNILKIFEEIKQSGRK